MGKFKQIIIFGFTVISTVFLSLEVKNWYNSKNYPEITFTVKHIDMDTINNPIQAEIFFNYTNTGNENLKIFNIETSCGCTIPTFNDELLAPKAKDRFKVRYETENKGHFSKEIMVYSNSRTSPDRLVVTGYVPFE